MVIGGAGSGKSAFAEQCMTEITDVKNKYYVATMRIFDDEGRKKAERHRELRRGKGFLTIEQPVDIEQAVERMQEGEAAVLLECMSNLTANEMFGERMRPADEVAEKILAGIFKIRARTRHLIIVTNNVFEDGILYEDGVTEYLRALAAVNRRLARMADEVTEVASGLPVVVKREKSRK